MSYNGLADRYLVNYFARETKLKDLQKTGMIDKFGNLNPRNEVKKVDRDSFAV